MKRIISFLIISIMILNMSVFALETAGSDSVVVTVKPDWTEDVVYDYDRHFQIDGLISFTLIIENKANTSTSYYYKWLLDETEGNAEKIELSANDVKRIKVTLPAVTDGKYSCGIALSSDGSSYTEERFDVSYIKSVMGEKNTRGYSIHLHRSPVKETMELLNASGIKIIRDEGFWSAIEKTKDEYYWGSVDYKVKAAQENGIDMLYILGYDNPLYYSYDENGKRVMFGSETEIQGFLNYCKAVAERYPYITRYEFWNEPNFNRQWGGTTDSDGDGVHDGVANVEKYKEVAKRLSQTLKSVNPDIELIVGVTGDVIITEANKDTLIPWDEFLSALLDDDLVPYIDAVSFHTYMQFHWRADERDRFDIVKALMDEKGGFLKLYLTETGGYAYPEQLDYNDKTQKEKNEEMVRIFTEADAHGIDYTMIYDFVKDGSEPENSEHHYGVITDETDGFEPTETYYSVKTFLGMANNAEYMGSFKPTDNIIFHVYLYENKPVIVAWGSTAWDDDTEYSYTFENNVFIKDLFGKEVGETTTIFVTGSPIYIYGADNSYIKKAAYNMAKEEINGLEEKLNKDFSAVTTAIENIQTVDDVYAVINSIFGLSTQCIEENNLSTKSNFSRLYTAAEYVAKTLSAFDEAKELSYSDLVKAYNNYAQTMEDVKGIDTNGAEEVFEFTKEKLEEVKSFVKKNACFTATDNNLYVLDEDGVLTIAGESTPGDLVTIKLVDGSGNIAYIGTVTADKAGLYSARSPMVGEYGNYSLSVKTAQMDEVYTTGFKFAENTDYKKGELKIHYGQIVLAERLIDLSREMLFTHADTTDFLLLDIAWKNVGDKKATAKVTVKNNSTLNGGTLLLCGYEEETNVLKTVKPYEVDFSTGDKAEYSYDLEYEEKPYIIKAYMWNDLNQMIPIKNIVATWQ